MAQSQIRISSSQIICSYSFAISPHVCAIFFLHVPPSPELIWAKREAVYFREKDWKGKSQNSLAGQSDAPHQRGRIRATCASIAPHDAYGTLTAVMSGNGYGFRGTTRHIGAIGRDDHRRISMCPIPGNIILVRVLNLA